MTGTETTAELWLMERGKERGREKMMSGRKESWKGKDVKEEGKRVCEK